MTQKYLQRYLLPAIILATLAAFFGSASRAIAENAPAETAS